MARPPIPPGGWGSVRFYTQPDGRVLARSRYRQLNGHVVLKRAIRDTAEEAERAMKASVNVSVRGAEVLSVESTIPSFVRWWLAGLRTDELQAKTIENYRYDGRAVSEAFPGLRLRELSVLNADSVIADLARTDARRARRVHRTLGQMCDEAVRLGVLEDNPLDRVRRPKVPARKPHALTARQAVLLRDMLSDWLATRHKPGPLPDVRVAAMVDVMLGTGIRISELLALRHCDVDLRAQTPTLLVAATLIEDESGRPVWQGHPKDERQRRRIVLPAFSCAALASLGVGGVSESPIFQNRNGAWIRPGTVRRILNNFAVACEAQLGSAGIKSSEVSPHLFRRTVASLVASELGLDRAREQLGHASNSTTERHYVAPPPTVGSKASEVLGEIFGRPDEQD